MPLHFNTVTPLLRAVIPAFFLFLNKVEFMKNIRIHISTYNNSRRKYFYNLRKTFYY